MHSYQRSDFGRCEPAAITASSHAPGTSRHAWNLSRHRHGRAVGVRQDNPGGGDRDAAYPEIVMARRSLNSHELNLRAFPFCARMRRDDPFRSADDAEWKAEADRIAGGTDNWYSHAG